MAKFIVVLVTVTIFSFKLSFSQDLKMELNGNGSLEFQKVTDIPNKSNEELYKETLDWIAYTFRNTESVIQAQIENEMVRLNGISSHVINGPLGYKYGLKYTIRLDLKDEKTRFTAYDLILIGADAAKSESNLETNLIKKNGNFREGNMYVKIKDGANIELNKIYLSYISSLTKAEEVSDDW